VFNYSARGKVAKQAFWLWAGGVIEPFFSIADTEMGTSPFANLIL